MIIKQIIVAVCLCLATEQIAAVVNNSKSANLEESTSTKNSTDSEPDSVSEASEQNAKRREAPAISDSYGAPLTLTATGIDSYVPSGPSNPNLPIPVYGVPDAPTNHIVYPAPPPDIPPALPFKTYGPPQVGNFLPPPPPKYIPPVRPVKPFRAPRPRPQYGPPKPIFIPKPIYGPPKPIYGPPKGPLFAPQKNIFKQQSVTVVTIPQQQDVFGFRPPEPIPHGPPHPGVPAPPTPPDIKYDGWQPIPGLVSRPPSDSYGVPEGHHAGGGDLHFNTDFVPPPISGAHFSSSAGSHSGGNSYNLQGVSDSYGAPLNSVTGSGGIVTSSGDELHDDHSLSLGLSAAGINSGQNHLSVIKSIGYELFPNVGNSNHLTDSYSAPPLNSYSTSGPYAAAHSYKTHGIESGFNGHNFQQGLSLSSSGIGLIPPNGFYGVSPNSNYGTPLLTKPNQLNALKINPPKHPVIFRDPVPTGLLESVGQHTAHKDAHGIIESAHSGNYVGPAYIPPPVPDVSKPVKEHEPPAPSTLYSLPNPSSSLSFQNYNHGTSSFSLGANQFGNSHNQILTSYTAPLGSIDGSYGLPIASGPGYSVALDNAHSGGVTVGIDNSHPPLTIDLTGANSQSNFAYQNIPHDCSLHKLSQPLPSLSYGVPSANSYTAALSGLTTNIGGAYQGSSLSDLTTTHSQKASVAVPANSIEAETHGKSYGQALAQNFGPHSELIKSESIDINNIPLQGSLGSYTLQIQPANGLHGAPNFQHPVPHAQVLNDGLLQSILAAIEHPEKKDATILGQPLLNFQDAEAQHSVTNAVVVSAPTTEATTPITSESESDTDAPFPLIDSNEIALYFSNKDESKASGTQRNSTGEVRNGQQYGSYVSFKTPNSGYSYENTSEKTLTERD